jgi:hypothetical protein
VSENLTFVERSNYFTTVKNKIKNSAISFTSIPIRFYGSLIFGLRRIEAVAVVCELKLDAAGANIQRVAAHPPALIVGKVADRNSLTIELVIALAEKIGCGLGRRAGSLRVSQGCEN